MHWLSNCIVHWKKSDLWKVAFFFVIFVQISNDMITSEQVKEMSERRDALRRYL